MDFDRTWTQFAVDAEVDHFGTKRLVDAHNTKVAALEAKLRGCLPAEQVGRAEKEMRILWDVLMQDENLEKQALILVAALAQEETA